MFVGLPGQGDEVQVKFVGFCAQAETYVGDASGHGEGDLHVGVQFGPVDGVRCDSDGGEQLVEQDPRAGTYLPLGDAQRGEICGGADGVGVARCDEEAVPGRIAKQVAEVARSERRRERCRCRCVTQVMDATHLRAAGESRSLGSCAGAAGMTVADVVRECRAGRASARRNTRSARVGRGGDSARW